MVALCPTGATYWKSRARKDCSKRARTLRRRPPTQLGRWSLVTSRATSHRVPRLTVWKSPKSRYWTSHWTPCKTRAARPMWANVGYDACYALAMALQLVQDVSVRRVLVNQIVEIHVRAMAVTPSSSAGRHRCDPSCIDSKASASRAKRPPSLLDELLASCSLCAGAC